MGRASFPCRLSIIKSLSICGLLIACFTVKQVNDKVCDALCRRNYDGGYSVKDTCVCLTNAGKTQDFMLGRIPWQNEVYKEPLPVPPPVVEFKY